MDGNGPRPDPQKRPEGHTYFGPRGELYRNFDGWRASAPVPLNAVSTLPLVAPPVRLVPVARRLHRLPAVAVDHRRTFDALVSPRTRVLSPGSRSGVAGEGTDVNGVPVRIHHGDRRVVDPTTSDGSLGSPEEGYGGRILPDGRLPFSSQVSSGGPKFRSTRHRVIYETLVRPTSGDRYFTLNRRTQSRGPRLP
ncbi:Hypothetical predicted protein [Marmota monax]|uniref:Uncharacterized protein n=1 Tax=Marmota monax TaxID=9995 RepID=A0A5E4B1C5_MARMO|nr:Hypothetical predicted protein [Marmota monax]